MADTCFDGNYYWITSEQLDNADLYIIDWNGLQMLKKMYKDKPIKTIIVNADKTLRITRMKARGDTDEKVNQRIEHDEKAFSEILKHRDQIDIIISNNYQGNIKGLCAQIHQCIQDCENNLGTDTKMIYTTREIKKGNNYDGNKN